MMESTSTFLFLEYASSVFLITSAMKLKKFLLERDNFISNVFVLSRDNYRLQLRIRSVGSWVFA